MSLADTPAPAPKRGRYDRSQTRQQRQAEQRDRLISSLATLAMSGEELTVGGIVARAGVGRNTFYEYFDDVEHALRTLRLRAVRSLAAAIEGSLGTARAPLERLRAATHGWVHALTTEPSLMALALTPSAPREDPAQASPLALHLRSVLATLSRDHGTATALPGIRSEKKRIAVSAVFDALSRDSPAQSAPGDLLKVLSDLAAALLR